MKDLKAYRGLWISLARRDFKVRYTQTALGALWALIQPLISIAVLYLVFKQALKADTAGIPFLSYTLSGLLFWGFFNYNLSQGSAALIQSRAMIQKIYFPRILLVLSKGIVASVDLFLVLLLFIIIAYSNIVGAWINVTHFLWALALCFLSAQGLALWISALSIRYRDLQQVIPFFSQLLFFLSPIAYSPELWTENLSESHQIWLYLNPMFSALEIWRSGIFDLSPLALPNALLVGNGFALFLFISGWWFFQKSESKMADQL